MTPSDAALCALWLSEEHPQARADAGKLERVLSELVAREHLKGMLIEARTPGAAQWKAAGLGVSGFVAPQLIDAHLSEPRPFFFMDLLGFGVASQGEIFLSPDKIAAANAGSGLDLVLHYMQRDWNLADRHWRSVCTMAHDAYVTDHCGYRLRRALQEDWAREPDIYVATGYRTFAEFALGASLPLAHDRTRKPRRTLYYADEAEVRKSAPGSTIAKVFQFAPPQCGFTPAEQRILLLATRGLTDEAIGDALKLSLNSVKQAWRRTYERVERRTPFVLSGTGAELLEGRRGPEKRRRVLAFLATHAQELRPFRWKADG